VEAAFAQVQTVGSKSSQCLSSSGWLPLLVLQAIISLNELDDALASDAARTPGLYASSPYCAPATSKGPTRS